MMNIRQIGSRFAVAALALAFATPAQAQTFFDRSEFNAAFSLVQTNDLNALANGSTVISFGTIGNGTLTGATVNGGQINNTASPFTFSIAFSQLVGGFGADFTNAFGGRAATFRFFNGTTSVGVNGGYGGTGFIGAKSTDLFNRVEISEVPIPGNGASLFTSLDNLAVGVVAPMTTVPEPSTFLLVGVGVVAMAFRAKSRKNQPSA